MPSAPPIKFILTADGSQAIGTFRQVNIGLQTINTSTAKTGQSMLNLSTASGGLSDKMRGLALRFVGYNLILNQVMNIQQKVIQGIVDSVDAYRELQLRMSEISTIIENDGLSMMNELTQGVQAMSQEYGKSSSDVAKGLYDILSAAFETGDALMLLNTATKAAIAGLSDIRTSVDIFTTVLNAYGMSVYQAAKVSDILFQSVIRGKFQFEDLESALGYIVPIAAQVGVAFDEMMAALSTATRYGLHIDMAARGLAMAIQGIINPSNEATVAAEKYGVEMNGLALEVLGLYGWFEQLNEATNQFGTQILSEIIPNIRSLRVAMVLAGDEGLGGFKDDLLKIANMGNRTEVALKQIMETSSFVSSQMAQEMEQTKRDVGADWDEMVMGMQSGILKIVKFFTGNTYESHVGDMFKVTGNDMRDMENYFKIIEEKNKTEDALNKARERKNEPQSALLSVHFLGLSKHERTTKEIDDTIKNLNLDLQEWILKEEELAPVIQEVVGGIQDQLDAIGQFQINLMDITNDIVKFIDELKTPKISGWGSALKTSSVSINEFTSLTDKQREAIERLGGTIQGTLAYEYELLKANQAYADVSHDVEMGLKMEDYNYKAIPPDIQKAIDAVREFTAAEKASRQATEQMSAALRILQIEQLEIELKGMIRRRGLTHAEERRLKQIQIEEAKIRLANMKTEAEQTVETVANVQTQQDAIDDYMLKLQEEQYILKYNYDQQIIDLENMIGIEAVHLTTRYDWWKLTNQNIIDDTTTLMTQLETLMSQDVTGVLKQALIDIGLDVDAMLIDLETARGTATGEFPNYEGGTPTETETPIYNHPTLAESRQKSILETPIYNHPTLVESRQRSTLEDALKIWGVTPKMHTGTNYVPETRPYMLEKGETVGSKNTSSGGNTNNTFDIKIINPSVRNDDDITKIAKNTENVVRACLINKQTGRSKFRMA